MTTVRSDLYRVIRDYGEDKFAKNIAKHIVQERAKKPIETTGELTEIIRACNSDEISEESQDIRQRGRFRQFVLS